MTAVILDKPEIAMASDYEGTRLILPRLANSQPTTVPEVTVVGPADGDEYPVAFGGRGRRETYELSVRFSRFEHDEMAALLDLFTLAHRSPDRRLVLRPNAFLVVGLDPVAWMIVTQWRRAYLQGQAWDVAWTGERVVGSAEV